MKKPLRIFLWIVGSIVLIFAGLVAWSMRLLSHPDYVFTNGRSLQENVAGRWDWSTHSARCSDSTHVIAFSNGGRVMTITQQHPLVDSLGKDWTVTSYDILRMTPSRIEGAIRGEPRRTKNGAPVVWELVVFDSNTYHWHRTDWPAWGYTAGIVRCSSGALVPSR